MSDPQSILLPPVPQEAAGERLDRYLADALAARAPDAAPLSRSRLKALILEGAVAANGAIERDPSRKVRPGEAFALALPEAAPAAPEAQAIPLRVVFEDAHLIVVDKPAGLVVHPAPGNPDRTLVNALLHHCGDSLSGIGGVKRPGIVHRIDKETSGLVVAAKTEAAHQGLAALFARHEIAREYVALAWGLPGAMQGTITGSIGRDPKNRKRMAVTAKNSKEAVTHYAVEQVLRDEKGQPFASLLRCRLETGRTHQIRVHLASSGHGLVGDPLYGRNRPAKAIQLGAAQRAAIDRFHRQALHAAVLGFRHPVTGKLLHFESPVPDDFAALLVALGARLQDRSKPR